MSLVVDALLTLAWYFEDASSPDAEAVLDQIADAGAVVPGSWKLEVAEAFQAAVGRERIDAVYRDASLAELGLMPIAIDTETSTYAWSTTLRLAERFSLPVHTAAYLELAQRRGLPLATLDRGLRAAAPVLGVELLGGAP